jgi:integrase
MEKETAKRGDRFWASRAPLRIAIYPSDGSTLLTRQRVYESLIRFQILTGWRSGEACALRVDCLDRSEDVWRYEFPSKLHKNTHRGKKKAAWIGAKGQAIVKELIATCVPADDVDPQDLVQKRIAKETG